VIVAFRFPSAGGTTDAGPADAFAQAILDPGRPEVSGIALEQAHSDQQNRHGDPYLSV
jgi:hypothetical protein